MNVKQLIEKLKDFPQDMEVVILDRESERIEADQVEKDIYFTRNFGEEKQRHEAVLIWWGN